MGCRAGSRRGWQGLNDLLHIAYTDEHESKFNALNAYHTYPTTRPHRREMRTRGQQLTLADIKDVLETLMDEDSEGEE